MTLSVTKDNTGNALCRRFEPARARFHATQRIPDNVNNLGAARCAYEACGQSPYPRVREATLDEGVLVISNDDRVSLARARDEAQASWDEGGVPIGAALVHDGDVLAVGRNRRVQNASAILHGETDCLERAGRLPAEVYRRSVLYTTLSPCYMCAGAIVLYGIPRVVIGENTSFQVSEDWLRSHGVRVDVVDDPACTALMTRMIRERPEIWREDIGETA